VLGAGVARAPEIDSAYGTALIGLNGLGVYSTIQEAQRCADFEKDYLIPNANSHNLYNEIFAVYQKIQQRLKPIYHQ
jgi:sugar (pentulose or hexulose) kinase